ncbi:hypothetical protein EYE40_09355 [Glaciihabitans arcticus]|uniref:Uncharacterized protein n=1 Tax=Glaciihabitans arcticus TaxID=2668039 RepID=A0A4Q9GWJ2_9MICO|nr:hypothetical protein [Glaciihabitans arcticus]TBN57577.1 hypothetical protein EYE40_09355 [Glaciihabitans arcticus]
MTIDPEADAMVYNAELVLPAATDTGFTEDQILEAQKTAARLVVEFGLDSTAADDTSTFAEWTDTATDDVLASQTGELFADESNLVFRQDNNASPDFIHDGKPRMDDTTTVTLTEVTGGSADAEGNYLSFTFQTLINYRATDEAVIAAVVAASPEGTLEEVMAALVPEVADGEGENRWDESGTVQYTMLFDEAQERWLIGGYHANYDGGYNLRASD